MTGADDRPLVVVLLGTDHHRFDRLVDWAAELSRAGELRWFVQHGRTPLAPQLEGRPMLPVGELGRLLDEAAAVVTHGGPGLIMEARSAGHVPIVVPRDPARGEHVDGHQIDFTRRMLDTGQVRTAGSAGALAAQVRDAMGERLSRGTAGVGHRRSEQSERAAQRFGELVADLCPSTAQATLPAHESLSVGGPGPAARRAGDRIPLPRQRRSAEPPASGDNDPDTTPAAPLPRGGRRLREGVARARPVTLLAAELTGACLAAAALDAPVSLLVAWAFAMTLVHATGGRYAERQPVRHGLQLGGATLAVTAVTAFLLGLHPDRIATTVAIVAMAGTATLLHVVRLLARRSAGTARPRVVLVGTSGHLPRLVADLQRRGGLRVDVVGVCLTDTDDVPDAATAGLPASAPVTTGLLSVLPTVKVMDADAVVAMPWSGLEPAQLRRLEWQLARHGTDLWIAPGLVDTDPLRTSVLSAGAARLLRVRPSSLFGTRRMLKDACERAAAAVALVLLAPVIALLMLSIRLESGHAALFRQRRVGRNGAEFTLFKLRTMVPDAEERLEHLLRGNDADGHLFKLRQDPRVTRLGRVLRRYSLDELPQLWNVLRGEMSLIGPRPPLPREVEEYSGDTLRRLAVKPGLTGLWQVSGRSDLSWEESQRLDLKYVDNWSLRLDLAILLRTVRAVLSRQGAY